MGEMSPETIDKAKAALIIKGLTTITEGPREAYGVLCLAIYLLNFEINEITVSIDELIDEVGQSLRSIRKHGTQ